MFEPDPEFDKRRSKANQLVYLLLGHIMSQRTEQRFNQVLNNYGFNQHSLVEPQRTVASVLDSMKLHNMEVPEYIKVLVDEIIKDT